jgi:hypothetical protein
MRYGAGDVRPVRVDLDRGSLGHGA